MNRQGLKPHQMELLDPATPFWRKLAIRLRHTSLWLLGTLLGMIIILAMFIIQPLLVWAYSVTLNFVFG